MMRQYDILLVDDELTLLKTVGWILESKGYQVTKALNGTEAINALGGKDFHLVISDLDMGEPDGIKILQTAKEMNPGIKVMIFTGNVDVAQAANACRLGADDYLLKPVSPDEFIERVNKCLDRVNNENKTSKVDNHIPYQVTGL